MAANKNIDWSDLKELYLEKGLSDKQIAKIKGCSKERVRYTRARLGIPRRPLKYDWSDLADLYIGQGLSWAKIATLKGCSAGAVQRAMLTRNIPRRSWREASPYGENHPSWKGGRTWHNGYIYVHCPGHPYARKGYVFEHRLVMENKLGRYLMPWEIVHHLNAIRDDNRPDNLEVYPSSSQHFAVTQLQMKFKVLEQEVVSLRKDIRLLRWQNKELLKSVQYRLE